MATNCIYLSYLPSFITTTELESQLITQLPEVFKAAKDAGSLVIKVYNAERSPVAVITGIDCMFEKLLLKFSDVRLFSSAVPQGLTGVNVKLDSGEERDDNGMYLQQKHPYFRQIVNKLAGVTRRKVINVFSDDLLAKVNIFDGFSSVISLEGIPSGKQINEVLLAKSGKLIEKSWRDYRWQLRYSTPLECLQAIMSLNNNIEVIRDQVHSHSPQVSRLSGNSGNKKIKANCTYRCGLGRGGSYLPIRDELLSKGYLPISEVETSFLRIPSLYLTPNCRHCNQKYVVIGITMLMDSVAARCKCDYGNESTPAVYWTNENFTRLVVSRPSLPNATGGNLSSLMVQYMPARRYYMNKMEYVRTMMPILFEEWKEYSSEFKTINEIIGFFEKFKVVSNENQSLLIATMIVIKAGNIWLCGNPSGISKCTINYKKEKKIYQHKTKVFGILNGDYDNLLLLLQFESETFEVDLKTEVQIVPKPNKSDYNALKKGLKTWMDKDRADPNDFLMMNTLPGCGQIHTISQEQSCDEEEIQRVVDTLNEEQKLAVAVGRRYNASFIHGPAGTGKTYTVSALINVLNISESGNIIVSCPSNEAADNVAIEILNISDSLWIKHTKLLRVFSHSKEEYPLLNTLDKSYAVLHEQVQFHKEWMDIDKLKKDAEKLGYKLDESEASSLIKKASCRKQMVLMNEKQVAIYKAHKFSIAREIMYNFNIFVMTVAECADYRITSFMKKTGVWTIVIDEAGQLAHPATIHIVNLRPNRIIFAGDPLQLNACLNSYVAQQTGIDLSVLELNYMSANCKNSLDNPWITLRKQHRMTTDIRKLVSHVTYFDQLQDAESIKTRETNACLNFIINMYCNKRIIVLNHSGIETKIQHSFQNTNEIDVTVRTIISMVQNGILADLITVLTFYKEQKKAMIERFLKLGMDVNVSNVDAFQGKENEVIVLSFVRSNRTRDIGFLMKGNRLNVAISRAKEFLFLVMNLEFYEESRVEHLKKLTSFLRTSQSVVVSNS